jgi:4-amino-4-deoxy-L-arabinose transferase-like glycosyltransferase
MENPQAIQAVKVGFQAPSEARSAVISRLPTALRDASLYVSAHRSMFILCLVALIPLFVDLGGEALWSDEGDTAVLGLSVKQFGIPKAWDGKSFIDSDRGLRENDQLVVLSHPFVQYYVAAASFMLFGESTFSARFPFALAGWFTIIAVYLLAYRLTTDKRAALSAAILLLISSQFLLYARQSRNYALAMLLTCILLLAFLKLHNWKSTMWFALVGILLFHTHPAGAIPLSILGALTLTYKPLRNQRKWFWVAAPLIATFTVPWIFLTINWSGANIGRLTSLAPMPQRLLQFAIECGSVTTLVAAGILSFLIWYRAFKQRNAEKSVESKAKPKRKHGRKAVFAVTTSWSAFSEGERTMFVLVISLLIAYGILVAATHEATLIFSFGVRQVAAVIPLVAILTGTLVAKWSQSRFIVWVGIMTLLAVTKLGTAAPWLYFCETEYGPFFKKTMYAAAHKPKTWKDRIFRTSLMGVARDLWQENPGTVQQICDFINANTKPDDILITNYGWEPLYFHTRRPLGLTILPEYHVCKAARYHSLPEYVFSVDRAQWLIWRAGWGGYQGYDGPRISAMLNSRGAKVEKVSVIPETLWENRENVHFRRFPGGDRTFDWLTNVDPAVIYRIHWPKPVRSPEEYADDVAPILREDTKNSQRAE